MQQVAFITGSARGIGFAIAKALAQKGFAIAINDREDSDELNNAYKALLQMGAKAVKIPLDVTHIAQYDDVLDKIESQLGHITTLVNNAGVSVLHRGDMLEVSEESFDRCMNINSKAMFFLSQAYAKRVLARKRNKDIFYSIINITSSNARAVALPRTEYAVSKAAAAMISQSFAVRLGSEGIYVYDVQPGLISTEMTKTVIDQYDQRAKDGLTVIPRVGQADEIGAVTANLANGAMPYVTGQVISADGGLLISRY